MQDINAESIYVTDFGFYFIISSPINSPLVHPGWTCSLFTKLHVINEDDDAQSSAKKLQQTCVWVIVIINIVIIQFPCKLLRRHLKHAW